MIPAVERQGLRLQPGEGILVVLFGALMLVNSLAMQVSYVLSLSGFLKSDGLQLIWVVWLVDYGLFLLIAAIQSLFIDRFDRATLDALAARRLLGGVRGSLARASVRRTRPLGVRRALPGRGAEWMLFPLFFWVLAHDAMNVAKAKRLFPLMASWGLAGKLLGLTIAASAPALLTTFGIDLGHLLLLNLLLYVGAFAVLHGLRGRVAERPTKRTAEGIRQALSGGFEFIRNVPTFRYLTWALLALMIVDTLVEFLFLAATDAAFTGQAAYQAFYGTYRMVLVTLAYGIQALVTRRLLVRMSLKQALSLQPYVAFTVLVGLLALPGVGSAIGALFLLRLVGETFHDSAKKALQGLVPEDRRGRVSLILESVVVSLGTIVGALVIGIVTIASGAGERFAAQPVYLAVALASTTVALIAVWRMRRTYESSLLSWRLQRRQRSGASLLGQAAVTPKGLRVGLTFDLRGAYRLAPGMPPDRFAELDDERTIAGIEAALAGLATASSASGGCAIRGAPARRVGGRRRVQPRRRHDRAGPRGPSAGAARGVRRALHGFGSRNAGRHPRQGPHEARVAGRWPADARSSTSSRHRPTSAPSPTRTRGSSNRWPRARRWASTPARSCTTPRACGRVRPTCGWPTASRLWWNRSCRGASSAWASSIAPGCRRCWASRRPRRRGTSAATSRSG